MAKTPCYWLNTGKHQADYERLRKKVEATWCSGGNHEKLFLVMNRIYYGVHNNGDCNWYMLIENWSYNLGYKVPHDAPIAVHNFFDRAVHCQYYTHCENGYHRDFTEEEVEEIMDLIIEYVVAKESEQPRDGTWEDIKL